MEEKLKSLIDSHSIIHNTQGFALFNRVLGICKATKEEEEYLKQAFDNAFKPAHTLIEEIEKFKNSSTKTSPIEKDQDIKNSNESK